MMFDEKDMFKKLLDEIGENIQKEQAKESMDEFAIAVSEMAKYIKITYDALRDVGFTDGQAYNLAVDMLLNFTVEGDCEDE